MVRIPVPLSLKFKSMTQRGIELQALDVSFVSSFSWYVLVSVGISGVISLLLGRQSTVNDAAAMEQQMKMGQAGQPMDTPKLYQAEQEALRPSLPGPGGAAGSAGAVRHNREDPRHGAGSG